MDPCDKGNSYHCLIYMLYILYTCIALDTCNVLYCSIISEGLSNSHENLIMTPHMASSLYQGPFMACSKQF